MTPLELGALLLGVFFLLIFLNVPITISLGASTLILMFAFDLMPNIYADILYTGISKYALIAIPFFILSGIVMERTGISKSIVDFCNCILGPIPGGLAIVSLVVTVFWGAVSGSGPATVAALGVVLIPAMIDAGYDRGFAAAIIAAGGGISIVIPPSCNFILFGTLTGSSVAALFSGGVVPGLLMGGCFLVYIVIFSIRHGYRGARAFGTPKEIWAAFKHAFLGLLTPVIILGGIYGGIFTPTEAAMVAVVYAILTGWITNRDFKLRTSLLDILSEAGLSSASVLIILANAAVFAWFMTANGIATAFSTAMLSLSDNKYVLLLLMLLIVIIFGFFLDGNSIAYILTPLFLPIISAEGVSVIWLGVMMAMGISIGLTTPPVAVNLYPAARIAQIDLATISKGIVGFVIAGIIACIIVVFVPELVLWLPGAQGLL